ncbi:hypothetical protein ACJMK2_015134, partial [Sinanodonta woodiana]
STHVYYGDWHSSMLSTEVSFGVGYGTSQYISLCYGDINIIRQCTHVRMAQYQAVYKSVLWSLVQYTSQYISLCCGDSHGSMQCARVYGGVRYSIPASISVFVMETGTVPYSL